MDVCSTKRSFALHTQIFERSVREVEVPSEALSEVEVRLASLKTQVSHSALPLNTYVDVLFPLALMEVDLASTPGHCDMAKFGTVNSDALGYDYLTGKFNPERVGFLKMIVKDRMRRLQEAPVFDHLKVFVKREPHKLAKILEGRMRLISSVSLVDAMIDRLLFLRLVRKINCSFIKTGIMIGWTPLKGGFRHVDAFTQGQTVLMADRSSWDWTFGPWLVKACLDVILDLVIDPPEWWRLVVINRFKSLFDKPTFRFDDGEIVEQKMPGIMKSGCYLTIALNSIAQLIVHAIAKPVDPFKGFFLCLGDDTLQSDEPDEYLENIKQMGITLKVHRSETVEFAGFILSNKWYLPAYTMKHLFRLKHLPFDHRETLASMLENYQVLYAADPKMLQLLREIAVAYGLLASVVSIRRLKELSQG